MLLSTSALAFVPAASVLLLAASTTLAALQTGHRDTGRSRDVSAPSGAPRKARVSCAGTFTLPLTYAAEGSKAQATPAP